MRNCHRGFGRCAIESSKARRNPALVIPSPPARWNRGHAIAIHSMEHLREAATFFERMTKARPGHANDQKFFRTWELAAKVLRAAQLGLLSIQNARTSSDGSIVS